MKKKSKFIKIGFILSMMAILLMPMDVHAITGTQVMNIVTGTWAGTSRVIPMLVKATGAASAWYRVPFSPAGIGVLAACVAGQWAWSKWGQPWWDNFAAENNYRKNGANIEKVTATSLQPKTGSNAANARSWFNANVAHGSPVDHRWFTSVADRNAAIAAYDASYPFPAYGARAGGGSTSNSGTTFQYCIKNGYSPTTYLSFNVSSAAELETVQTWSTRTAAQAASDLSAAVADGTLTDNERTMWQEVEKQIADEKAGLEPKSILLAVNPATSKTLDTTLNEQAESAINGDSTPAETSNTIVDAIVALGGTITRGFEGLQTYLGTLISNALTTVRGYFGLDDANPITDTTGVDANENTTVIDQSDITSDVNTAKEVTTGILDDLFDATTGLADRIKGKVESMVNTGSSVCSLSFSVFGANQVLDFCSIDYSVIRMAVLFVGTVAACMILLL